MTAYQRVQRARSGQRPTALAMIQAIFDGFFELHGDRLFGDDSAIVGGLATLNNQPLTVIGIEKGSTTEEKIMRNFGSAHPEGYRKALRLMQQAEKFGRPIVLIVDTAGAYCGIGAEERGQGSAIAQNLQQMMGLSVPILSIVLGEGGSGGALALAVANEVWMLENAVYSVISPEGAASILYKDPSKAEEAAHDLRLTAQDLHALNVVEKVFPEEGLDFSDVFAAIRADMLAFLCAYAKLDGTTIKQQRYERFRAMGRIENT